MSDIEQRVIRLENLVNFLSGDNRAMKADIRDLQQAQSRQQLGGYGGGSGGGPAGSYWCIGDGTAHVATGTWPTLTVATFTSDVYQLVGSTLTLVGTSKTINLPYKDAMSTTAGKLIPCIPNADGSTYDAQAESCNKVT